MQIARSGRVALLSSALALSLGVFGVQYLEHNTVLNHSAPFSTFETAPTMAIPGVVAKAPFRISGNSAYKIDYYEGAYHVTLSDTIVSSVFYEDLLRGLSLLKKTDRVVMHIAGFGGDVYGGVRVAHALKSTKARVDTIVEGPSFSMHANLGCIGDTVTMQPYAFSMFHNYSTGIGGKGNVIREYIGALDVLMENFLKTECKRFLSDRDVYMLINGKDIYVHPQDLRGE